jgi:hypothetical protein
MATSVGLGGQKTVRFNWRKLSIQDETATPNKFPYIPETEEIQPFTGTILAVLLQGLLCNFKLREQ